MSNVRWKPVFELGIASIIDGLLLRRELDRFGGNHQLTGGASCPHPQLPWPHSNYLFRQWLKPNVFGSESANDLIFDPEILPKAPDQEQGRQPRPRRLRRIGYIAGGAILSLALAACAYPYLAPDSITASYIEQHRATQAVELTDSRSRWLGVMSQSMSASGRGDIASASYVTIDTRVPEGWLSVVIALEDRNIRGWRSVYGIDVLSLGRATVGVFGGTDGRGGSTLVMQLVRSMRGINPSKGSPGEKIRRKFTEVVEGAALYHRLGGIGQAEFRQYLARHVALVVGAPGSRMGTPLHGLGMTSHVLWGVPPQELDLAQQSILAAAFWRPIIIAPDDDQAGIAARDERWRDLVERATVGLRRAYPGDPRAQAAIERLRTLPPPRPRLDGLDASRLTPSQRFQVAANPERRVTVFASPEMTTARGELLNRIGREGLSKVTAIRLTVDIVRNHQFRNQVRSHLRDAERVLRNRLSAPLLDRREQRGGADVIIALMHERRVIKFFSNSQEPLFNGSLSERDENGRFALDRTGRQVGSVGKVMLAVLFGRRDNPDTLYCNKRLSGAPINNPGGDAGLLCSQPHAWHPARSVFGESLILPLIWRARTVPEAQLRNMARRYRLSLPDGVSPRVAISTGLATGRPSDLAAMMRAVARGAAGRAAVASEPSMISAFRTEGDRNWLPLGQNDAEFDLRQDFSPPVARFVREVLSAPLRDGGTLGGLSRATPNAHLHVGKSGTTTSTDNRHTRDKYAVGAFHDASGDWSYIFLISARDARLGLGDALPWSAFLPLLRSTVSHLPPATE